MANNRKVLIFENTHTLANALVKKFVELAQYYIAKEGRFTAVFSGGPTPAEFFSKLSSMEDFRIWQRTHIFMVDERFVPADHHESNFKLMKDNLFNFANIPAQNIHSINTDCKNINVAAEEYKKEIVQNLDCSQNGLPSFDLIMLGVGEDGHSASLFSDDKNINDPRRVTLPVSLNHLKRERVTLTLPVINNAKHVYFQVQGLHKADIVKAVLEGSTDYPAAGVRPANGELVFFLDKKASHKLSYKDDYTLYDEAISVNL